MEIKSSLFHEHGTTESFTLYFAFNGSKYLHDDGSLRSTLNRHGIQPDNRVMKARLLSMGGWFEDRSKLEELINDNL